MVFPITSGDHSDYLAKIDVCRLLYHKLLSFPCTLDNLWKAFLDNANILFLLIFAHYFLASIPASLTERVTVMGFTKGVPWTDLPYRKITLKCLVVREFSKANTVK